MDCQSLREDLVAYLDDEVSPEVRARVDAHLTTCARCAEEVRVFARTWQVLESYQEIAPPAGLMESFLQRLASEDEQAPVIRISWVRRAAPYLAAAALIGVVFFLGKYRLGPPSNPPGTGPLAELTQEEQAIVRDLPILSSKEYNLLRNLKLVENYPVISNLTENDFEAL